jgi:hypothetical protein
MHWPNAVGVSYCRNRSWCMPTSLPVAFPAELNSLDEFFSTRTASTILTIWAAIMLLIGAVEHFGSEASALNSFGFLAIF